MQPAPVANDRLACGVLEVLRGAGVRTICLCAGARNAPFVFRLDRDEAGFEVIPFFEERSAAFFALGRILRDGSPAAVITTSGTAAAEALPATIEAFHAGLPLIVVTADRPRRLRHTGAPQTIDQPPIFAPFVHLARDLEAGDPWPEHWPTVTGPWHLNTCFAEPLTDPGPAADASPPPVCLATSSGEPQPDVSRHLADFFQRVRSPLVLLSTLPAAWRGAVNDLLRSGGAPVWAEAVSGLRTDPALDGWRLRGGEKLWPGAVRRGDFDGVVRFGGIPSVRFWRDLEDSSLPVLSVSATPFPGLARTPPAILFEDFFRVWPSLGLPWPQHPVTSLRAADARRAADIEALLASEPASEPALVRAFARSVPGPSRVLLGNSLPVRAWDLFAPWDAGPAGICANRGVNGIDGLVSTALGLAGRGAPVAALLGDLSALYDLAGLWPGRGLEGCDITLGILNNGGGQIFARMFASASFRNEHDLGFADWARMFGWEHQTVTDLLPPLGPGRRILEIRPDPAATRRFWQAFDALPVDL